MAKKKKLEEFKQPKRSYIQDQSSPIARNIGNKADQKRFLIVTEGETEVEYFSRFKEHLDKINRGLLTVRVEQSPHSDIGTILDFALEKAQNKNLFFHTIYPVFDRDSESNSEDTFNNVIQYPHHPKINSLYTNPCFEYWLVLHLQDSINLPCKEYQTILSKHLGNQYSKTDPQNFNRILGLNKNALSDAIRRSINVFVANQELLPSQAIPSTNMHKIFFDLADVLYEEEQDDKELSPEKFQQKKLQRFLKSINQ